MITSILVATASFTFLTPAVSRISREQLSGKITDFCLARYGIISPANCSARFPSSWPLDIPITVEEATTRPTPIFSLRGLARGPMDLVSPSALPATFPSAAASCFLFQGEKAYVHVKMASPASNLTGISIDYSAVRLVLDPVYSPREVSVWGLYRGPMNSSDIQQHLLLSTDSTIRPGPGGSSFILIVKSLLNPLSDGCMAIIFPETLSSSPFEAFAIQVLNNWGGDYTCLAPFLFYQRY